MINLGTQCIALSAEIWSMSVCDLVGELEPCNNPLTLSLLLDNVIWWRQLELNSAR